VEPRVTTTPLTRLGPLLADPQSLPGVADASGGIGGTGGADSFQQVLGDLLKTHAKSEVGAGKAIEQLAVGQADDLHTVSLAVAQADLTFRLLLELRNRATEAYQEVMRMQI
jgi:flagellar hook-basal body complex protein FliE